MSISGRGSTRERSALRFLDDIDMQDENEIERVSGSCGHSVGVQDTFISSRPM